MGCEKNGCCCEEITGLAHIGVFVQDIEKSKEFYTDVLCFECFSEASVETEQGVIKNSIYTSWIMRYRTC